MHFDLLRITKSRSYVTLTEFFDSLFFRKTICTELSFDQSPIGPSSFDSFTLCFFFRFSRWDTCTNLRCSKLICLPNFRHWAFPEKKNNRERGWGQNFVKTPLEFLIFYFAPGNSRQSKYLPIEIPQNCLRSLKNSEAKNQDLWKFHIIFSSSALEIPFCFQLTPRN